MAFIASQHPRHSSPNLLQLICGQPSAPPPLCRRRSAINARNWYPCQSDPQGTFTWPDGRKYVGEWRGGKLHGHGTFTYADGKQYVGEFRDDARNGQGTLMFPDGARFVGEYKDGKRNGQGTMTHPDGSVLHSGLWADDSPVE